MAKTILVLEEYGPSRVALCDCIEDLGYTAMPAHTIDEARALESNASIDLAIVDIDQRAHQVLVDDLCRSGTHPWLLLVSPMTGPDADVEDRPATMLRRPLTFATLAEGIARALAGT
jgi:hypothetical protein